MTLHVDHLGPRPPRFAFLHGLLGRGRNWAPIARGLAGHGLGGLLVDLPDHGRSPWTDRFDYDDYADLVGDCLAGLLGGRRIILVGHSLGGKVAMRLALRRPELLDGLAVVDIGPQPSPGVREFAPALAAMASLDFGTLASRADADAALAPAAPDPAVRRLLLQNLAAAPAWHWQPNLALLERSLDAIAGWPPTTGSAEQRVLWLLGGDSSLPCDDDAMRALFPRAIRTVVSGAGHWVHADQPQAVVDALLRFSRG